MKQFTELYEELLDIERAVFDETLSDLFELLHRRKPYDQGYLFFLFPSSRKLGKTITNHYNLKNPIHRLDFMSKRVACLDLLEKLSVITKKTKTIPKIKLLFTFWWNVSCYIGIKKEPFNQLYEHVMKTRDNDLKIPAYKITYDGSQIFLEGIAEPLRRTNPESQNALLFRYIYDHPNKTIYRDKINTYLQARGLHSVDRSMHDILKDLGFTGDVGRLFIKSKSKNEICFRNPVYYHDLKEIGMEYREPKELARKASREKIVKTSNTRRKVT